MFTTPTEIDATVAAFCQRVCPTGDPVFVPIQPSEDAREGFCVPDVEAKIETDGGTLVTGWTIWYEPEVFIEAEFHSCWRSPEGNLISVSPSDIGEFQVLFIPHSMPYEVSRDVPGNKRQALVDTLETRQRIALGVAKERLRAKFWTGKAEAMIPAMELDLLYQNAMEMVRGRYPNNFYCVCLSGKKFGRCCGVPFGTPFTSNLE